MNQYGAGGQHVPYSGQQEADLVNNPRYAGQSTGTNPTGHDRLVSEGESRYGVAPMNTAGGDGYGNPTGIARGNGYGNRTGLEGGDGYGNPRREGVVDRMEDAVGVGPQSGTYPHGIAGRGPYAGEDVDYPGEGKGFGSGMGGTTAGYDQPGVGAGLGTGHRDQGPHVVPGSIPVADLGERRVEPGYDASRGQIGHGHHSTLTGSPRKQGIVEKIKEAVGMGKQDHASQTYTGTTMGTMLPNTLGTGDAGLMRHGNTTSTTPGYSHNDMVDTGLGHGRHPGSNTGYRHERVGDRLEDGVAVGQGNYPQSSASAYPESTSGYPHETAGDRAKDAVGAGPRQGVTGAGYDYERRGKGFEDTPGVMHNAETGPGFDATRVESGTGYGDTNVGYPQKDANAYDAGGAPPKKGIMTKVKEKLHR